MDTKTVIQEPVKQPRFWSIMQITLAAAFAGPVGGCYLLGRNYQAFNLPKYAKIRYAMGFVGALLMLLITLLLPEDVVNRIPNFLWMLPSLAIIGSIAQNSQTVFIKQDIANGYRNYSYWWWLVMTVALGIVQFTVYLAFGSLIGLAL